VSAAWRNLHTIYTRSTIPSAYVRVALLRERNLSTVTDAAPLLPAGPVIVAGYARSRRATPPGGDGLALLNLVCKPGHRRHGGVTDSVRGTEHVGPNGQTISLGFGIRAPPGG